MASIVTTLSDISLLPGGTNLSLFKIQNPSDAIGAIGIHQLGLVFCTTYSVEIFAPNTTPRCFCRSTPKSGHAFRPARSLWQKINLQIAPPFLTKSIPTPKAMTGGRARSGHRAPPSSHLWLYTCRTHPSNPTNPRPRAAYLAHSLPPTTPAAG